MRATNLGIWLNEKSRSVIWEDLKNPLVGEIVAIVNN